MQTSEQTETITRREHGIRKAIELNPLDAAPRELAHDVWRTWACFQFILPSPLPLAGLIRCWVDGHGLTIEDARTILRAMTAPGAVGGFKFASDFMTALAEKVATRIKQREKEAETERIRRAQEEMDAESPKAERGALAKQFMERVGEIGVMPPRERPAPDATRNAAFLDAVAGRESRRAAG